MAVTFDDDGTHAKISVDMAGDIPRWPQAGEVIGVGVDLWRSEPTSESDYQLFAEGGKDGWFAHLQTSRGLVRYPGEFRLGGRRLVFELRWAHLGDLRSGEFRAFADWSRQRVGVNAASYDSAPTRGAAGFRR